MTATTLRGSIRRRSVSVCGWGLVALGVLAWIGSACAARSVPPAVTTPRYPEFLFPQVPPELASAPAAAAHRAAWQVLQAGDERTALRRFSDLVRRTPAFYPAAAGLGYVQLARRDFRGALEAFDAALARAPSYAPALVGRGEALLRLGRSDEAVGAFERALRVDPTLLEVRRRVELLGLRRLEELLAAARRARDAGRDSDARAAYERALAASPESGFLYRELAEVERRASELDAALTHARRAAELDPGDARAWVLLGELAEARGALGDAERAYARAAELDAAPDVAARLEQVRAELRLAALPAEYRAISRSPQLTRGALAALVGERFDSLLRAARPQSAGVLTDIRGHWAARWIIPVVRAGVMDAYPNHTFQPEGLVRRGDLAQVVSRLLALGSLERRPAASRSREQPPLAFADIGPTHLAYPAAAAAVAAGAMTVLEGNTFQLTRPVSGAEAIAALDRVVALVGEGRP